MRAVIVARKEPGQDISEDLNELVALAESAGYRVVSILVQQRGVDRAYQIGRGKLKELKRIVEERKADKVIFLNKLTASQIYNLTSELNVEVIDKFNLILEIFAKNARTRRAQLQVELAKLIYELPRARRMVSLMKRGERPGFKSLGRYYDLYERDIRRRIQEIKRELSSGEKVRENIRRRRKEEGYLVTLAGYTNAGQSTLMRRLTSKAVVSDDRLFTTLSPSTSELRVNGRRVFITDTVGFIKDLPPWMVAAFRSTMEEIFSSDLILLVVDASEDVESMRRKLKTSHEILHENNFSGALITVMNKVDKISKRELEERVNRLENLLHNTVFVSAATGEGIPELLEKISEELPKWRHYELRLPMSSEGMRILHELYEESRVLKVSFGSSIFVRVEARSDLINKMESRKDIEVLEYGA
ncbi:MAG: GTPase [Archaeoglobi archaeon]|nr:GTPase [Archaeoglobi archaeon]